MRPICRGTRSKYDSEAWTCDRCEEVNKPFKGHFFDVPKLACPCGKKCPHDFKINLRAILVNGYSVVRYVKKQQARRCTANAYTSAVEIKKCIKAVRKNQDPAQVPELDPDNLWENVQKQFPRHRICKMRTSEKVVHMGLMLKRKGVKSMDGKKYYKVSDVSTIKHDDLQSMLNAISNGEPLVAGIRSGKNLRNLKWCQIYKAPSTEKYLSKNNKTKTHAVVLIGGGLQNGFLFFYFLNSWGKFCVRRFLKRRSYYGVGKVRKGDLSRSVVMLASQDQAGTRSFREESGSTPQICGYNRRLVLGSATASKKSYREEEQDDLNAQVDTNDVVEVEDDEYGQKAVEEKNWNQLPDGKNTCQKKEVYASVKEQEAAEEHLAFKETTLPTVREELVIEAKQVDKEQLCNISPALAVSLITKEIKPRKSMFECEGSQGREGGEEANKASMAARKESDTTADVAAEVKVDAMLQELEKATDDVDAQIGNCWQRSDRDHDGK